MPSVTVLIADEDPKIRECLRRALETDSRFQVLWEAENGLQALMAVKQRWPDAVVLDAQLARMDGHEVTRCIRHSSPRTKIVIMSVYDADRVRAVESGADAFFIKDCGREAIVESLAPLFPGTQDGSTE